MTESQKKKQHYSWWGHVRAIVREHPDLCGATLHDGVVKRNFDAVEEAIEATLRMEGGQNHMKVIRLVHWDRTRTIEGAARDIPCDKATAYRWQKQFFEEIARRRDMLD